MPSRDVFIWCCVWCWKCQNCHKLMLSPIRNITYSCTRCSDLCNEQLINPFRLSYVLSLGSLVCSVMCGISTTHVNRKDFNEVWKAVLNRRDYNNSGDLLDFNCGGILLVFRRSHVWLDMRFETRDLNLLTSPCQNTDILVIKRKACGEAILNKTNLLVMAGGWGRYVAWHNDRADGKFWTKTVLTRAEQPGKPAVVHHLSPSTKDPKTTKHCLPFTSQCPNKCKLIIQLLP